MRGRDAVGVLVPIALHAAAREVDAALGVLLHTTLDLERFVPEALRLVDVSTLAAAVAVWSAAGFLVWLACARAGIERPAALFLPLLLRPAITLLAIASLVVDPVYPYGFTLPVALTQDWAIAQDIAAAAAMAAMLPWRSRVPAPGAVSVAFIAFVAYALLSPPWAYRWESHPGNEPKTLRMAVAIGHWASLDMEPVSTAMEALPTDGIFTAGARSVGTMARESGRMAQALLGGADAVGRDAIRATRVTRQTIRGKEGGVYTVLAPGPSVVLAPALRIDRWLNRRDGKTGRLAVTVTWWNALAAALVAALFRLLRDATGRPGLSALIAGAAAFTPPFLFYFFQFYPEMLGALVFAAALRVLLFRSWWRAADAWALGALLATLPWLHQKFLPAWAFLAVWALLKVVGDLAPARALAGIAVPQALSLFLFALYNFAITGSVRPDALFLAWGPGGVSGARVGQGMLGLLLDARFGVLPYVPVLLLGGAGLMMRGRLRRALPVMAVYYLTVAAADNWSGAVCSLGRYFMPAAPYAVTLGGVALARAGHRPAVRAAALTLGGWAAVVAWLLWNDPHAANDCAQLLARSAFADGNVYVPNLFLRTWADAAPGLWPRVTAWIALAFVLAWWIARGRAGSESPVRALGVGAAVLLALALVLERWPAGRRSPFFSDAIDVRPGVTVFSRDGRELLVRSRDPLSTMRIRATGEGTVRVPGLPPFVVAPGGTDADVPLSLVAHLAGRRGVEERLYRQRVEASEGVTVAIAR